MTRFFYGFAMLLLLSLQTTAQYTFQGRIEYERKVNLHRLYEDNEWFERAKSSIPKFKTSYFDLNFTGTESLYRPGRESGDAKGNPWMGGTPAPENQVHTDYRTGKVIALKPIFEDKFLIEDSLRKTRWKITGEVRTIAGYKCRKAVGIMCDSVYVVAFYTDEIAVSGGPESFGSLPGMILELAVPRLYTTWIATTVTLTTPKPEELVTPAKGKKTTYARLSTDLQSSFKDWGKEKDMYLWWSIL